MKALDRAIAAIAPGLAVRRAKSRALLGAIDAVRGFQAAGRGPRFDSWRTSNSSINADTARGGALMRARCRDLTANNPYARRAIDTIEANTVGVGIVPQVSGLGARATDRVEGLWRDWAGTPACDADGRLDFYGLQGLVMRSIAESGEVLIRARARRSKDLGPSLPIPLQLQVLEAEHLADDRSMSLEGNGRIFGGIEFDALGRRVAYHLYREHPGDVVFRVSVETSRVPADEVLHPFRRDRPGQHRGVPWGAPAVVRLLELGRYEDAQLLRQEIAACFAVAFSSIDDGPRAANDVPNEVQPGAVLNLGAAESVTMLSPPAVQGYAEFMRQTLLSIAVAYGVSYEALVGDLKGVNYSSGRMGWLEFQRNIARWQRHLMIAQVCRPVWGWFARALELMGEPVRGANVLWTPPRREMVDPTKEVPATTAAIRSGLQSRSDALRELGRDPEEVMRQIAADNAAADELGLVFDSDPRRDAPTPTSNDRDGESEDSADAA